MSRTAVITGNQLTDALRALNVNFILGRINWLGTYQHAAQVWQKGLEYKKN